MFNIFFDDIIKLLLPPFLRKKRRIAYLTAAIQPLRELNKLFNDKREEILFNISYSSQIAEFEDLLNWRFNDGKLNPDVPDNNFNLEDKRYTGIYIENSDPNHIYLYNNVVDQPLFVFNKSEFDDNSINKIHRSYLFNKYEHLIKKEDFIVHVPITVKVLKEALDLNFPDVYPDEIEFDNDGLCKKTFPPIASAIKKVVDKYKLAGMRYKIVFDGFTVVPNFEDAYFFSYKRNN